MLAISKLNFVIHRQFWQEQSISRTGMVSRARDCATPGASSAWTSLRPSPRSRSFDPAICRRSAGADTRRAPGRPLEVLICSDFPTQLALGATFAALGLVARREPTARSTSISSRCCSLADTVLLIGLVLLFLRCARRERPRGVLRRPADSCGSSRRAPDDGRRYAIALVVLATHCASSRRGCTTSSTTRCRI